ncbi:MAG: hypothetical protein IPL55_07510 [Saprospiraceae bacterium]|nr:hypothetical protein [Saprospiraceae bacterium]
MNYNSLCCYICLIVMVSILGCSKDDFSGDKNVNNDPVIDNTAPIDYSEIPQSDIYEVTIIKENSKVKQLVFKSTCPVFELGKEGMEENYEFAFAPFAGRTISWSNFSFKGSVQVEVKVNSQSTLALSGGVKILPSRLGIVPQISGNTISFTLNNPGQFSVEIGANGYKQGLMVFANPEETDVPDPTVDGYTVFEKNSIINSIGASYSGIYFKKGVYNIGVYSVPAHIKNIYFEDGSWVYGSLLMDGNPNVKIFGRGVLSTAKINYKAHHSIEAINQSNNIHLEGIVIADQRHFAVRLIGTGNKVKWIKIIGGWNFNTDGIAAFANSTISNCFIWANDDAIKPYRDNTTFTDCVVWQLNNGGVIQLGWTAPDATNINIQGIDIIRTEWNQDRFNVGIINYVGNRYNESGKTGYHKNWLIENVFTETPVQSVFNIAPDKFSE